MAFVLTCSVGGSVHRCSRCGQIGHNVRNCRQGRREWYAQRCSSCGEVGHNARNCAKVRAASENDGKCPVCFGKGTLPCGRCNGRGMTYAPNVSSIGIRRTVAAVAPKRIQAAAPAMNLSAQQREWAKMARERGRKLRGTLGEDPGIDTDADIEMLVGGGNSMVVGDGDNVGGGTNLVGGTSVPDVERRKWLRTAEDELTSGGTKCTRCLGLGYLCCLSCSD